MENTDIELDKLFNKLKSYKPNGWDMLKILKNYATYEELDGIYNPASEYIFYHLKYNDICNILSEYQWGDIEFHNFYEGNLL